MKSNFWMFRPTVRSEMKEWDGQAMHRFFRQQPLTWQIPYSFYKKYLYDMACEQKTRGGKVPQVIPNFGKEGTSSVWGDAACIIPWNLYLFYGDQTILEDNLRACVLGWITFGERIKKSLLETGISLRGLACAGSSDRW